MTSHATLTDFQTSFDKLDVSVLQGVIDDPLVLLDGDGTGWVSTRELGNLVDLHNITTGLAMGVNAIDSCEDKLFLQVTQSHNVFLGFLSFDLGVSCNHTETCARGVEKTSIEFPKHVG